MKLNDSFDLVATAPDGVARLRELILSLAVQGKLLAQRKNEEPAPVTASVRAKPLAPIPDEVVPFDLPKNWQFVRLGTVLEMINGRAFKASEWLSAGLPIVRIQNLNNPDAKYNYCDPGCVDEKHIISNGELLLSWSGTPGTSFGAFIWNRGTAALNQHIFKCVQIGASYVPCFLRLAINSQLHVLISQAQGGVGLQHVTKGTLENLIVVLPPVAEQSRILAKFDELMRLCDELESRGRLEAEQHASLTATLFEALVASESPHALAENWSRVAANFDLLLDRPEAVDALEQTVLQLALRGLLVSADKNDEPVDVLLEHIREEKSRKIAARKANGGKPRTGVLEEERPFEVPTHWAWCSLGELTLIGPNNGFSPKPSPVDTDVRCLSLSATTKGYFREDCFKFVDIPSASAEPYLLKKGDLLIQRANSLDYVGMAAVYDLEDDRFMYPDLMMRLRVASKLHVYFVHMYLISNFGRQYFKGKATGTQGTMPKINQGVVLNMPIPIPPAAEQARIVDCVTKLRGLCASLRARLTDRQSYQAHLAAALVEQTAAAGAEEGHLALAA